MRCVILNPYDKILLYSKFSVECEADDQGSGRTDVKLKCATTGVNKNACAHLNFMSVLLSWIFNIDNQGYFQTKDYSEHDL